MLCSATETHSTRPASRALLRRGLQAGFFGVFLLAPVFDLLRFDLNDTQLWWLGMPWSLGIDDFLAGRIGAPEAALGILLRGFLPGIAFVAGGLWLAWRYGRLYCGWLCPHFSAVELLNGVLRRAAFWRGGRYSLWNRHPLPPVQADGTPVRRSLAWWPIFGTLSLLLSALWAITLLTYLLPPREIWSNLWHGTLTPNQARFIAIGTAVFFAEFVLARHLFCRFGCAVGLFQSLAWMANPRGLVVNFDRTRARDCRDCLPAHGNACDLACPMQLHPRDIKRRMFSCVQCTRCLDACDANQSAHGREPLLSWTLSVDSLRKTRTWKN